VLALVEDQRVLTHTSLAFVTLLVLFAIEHTYITHSALSEVAVSAVEALAISSTLEASCIRWRILSIGIKKTAFSLREFIF
jgi:hypothetical protein